VHGGIAFMKIQYRLEMQSKTRGNSQINAGRADRITINEAAELIFSSVKWRPRKIEHDLEKPQSVASRATNLNNAEKQLGWRPKVDYEEGFEKTINWYFATKNKGEIQSKLERLQTER
jgi:nucleoside-diphosphate-sugar epimerase